MKAASIVPGGSTPILITWPLSAFAKVVVPLDTLFIIGHQLWRLNFVESVTSITGIVVVVDKPVGTGVGAVGNIVGCAVGVVGAIVGIALGDGVGTGDGTAEGTGEGTGDGIAVGSAVGF